MNATTNQARIAGLNAPIELAFVSDAARIANYATLSEIPGLLFGVVTLAYIVTSLLSLAL